MANKIKLGARPKSFKRTVEFPMLDGTTGAIEIVFKYRTKREFGELIDKAKEAATLRMATETDKSGDAEAKPEMTWERVHTLGIEANAEHLAAIIDGWNLDCEPTTESFQQLADEIPAAANAILEDYRKAIAEGRLGN